MILADRFWSKVDKTDSCWNWTASLFHNGYGQFRINNKSQRAHRISFELLKEKIPKGLVIDHLCRNPSCVNPDHLEAVTQQENCRRGLDGFKSGLQQRLKTHCKHGHKFSKENTYNDKTGKRSCKICTKLRSKKYRKYYK